MMMWIIVGIGLLYATIAVVVFGMLEGLTKSPERWVLGVVLALVWPVTLTVVAVVLTAMKVVEELYEWGLERGEDLRRKNTRQGGA
jgi:hypothetical protein|tara:strand:- start:858 stop:1115 length:258 start_codon:yes stop_codon:yes gene_type:complete